MITLEQVDQLRKRTNCSYEEAKALLEKHNGDVLEAIVEFEKSRNNKNYTNHNGSWDNTEWKRQGRDFWIKCRELIQKGFENKVIVEDRKGILFSVPVNIMLLFIIFVSYVTIPMLIILLLLGYRISIKKAEGKEYDLSSMVRDATDRFTGRTQQPQQNPMPPQAQNVPAEVKQDDYNEITIE